MEIVGENPASAIRLFRYWKNPQSDEIGATAHEFLHLLSGPSHIHLTGRDRSRCRAVVTLSHGNEPSGFFALYHLLQQQILPIVDIHFFVSSVEAAQAPPGFHFRMLADQMDLNRCFKTPFGTTAQDRLAEQLLSTLKTLKPEAVIDIHNTSGSGPSFGVTTYMDERHDALVSLFTHRMILTDLTIGSLMEISDTLMPTVTVECGGAQDIESHSMAFEGLQKYVSIDDVLAPTRADFVLDFFHNPIRLELKPGIDITYADQGSINSGVTLLPAVEHHNFGFVDTCTKLGFVSEPLENVLTAKNNRGEERLLDFFHLYNGELRPKTRLKLFMVTTNPEIARKDCLFYLVPENADDNLQS